MQQRFAAIWFPHLTTDWCIRRDPALKALPFALAGPERGRMIIRAVSSPAAAAGIFRGMAVGDGRALLPQLKVLEDVRGTEERLLYHLAVWCIRYTPIVAPDPPDGLLLDITGCAHLWGDEATYLKDITGRLRQFGYKVRGSIADTAGCAWAIARFGSSAAVIDTGRQNAALQPLPPAALRLPEALVQRLEKLGLRTISSFMQLPRTALRRRFGDTLLHRMDEALGLVPEVIRPVSPPAPYTERLPSMEPIITAKGIETGLHLLLDRLCHRLQSESMGLQQSTFKACREDGTMQQLTIGTNRPSRNAAHLFRLFALKIVELAPGFGFVLFVLEAGLVSALSPEQETLWSMSGQDDELAISDLLDRIRARAATSRIQRFLPQEHYWPERAMKPAGSLAEQPATVWRTDRQRPVHLLPQPQRIEVTVPLPDYPPMLFKYKGNLHQVKRADGPERIEPEWWLEQSPHRDYYCLEDEQGARYWVFRLGHYDDTDPQWFIHGFFA